MLGNLLRSLCDLFMPDTPARRMLVLRLLSAGPLSWHELVGLSGGELTHDTIYTVLAKMERDGLLRSARRGVDQYIYWSTLAGRAALALVETSEERA